METLIDELCSKISPENFRIENFPELIFMCGGPMILTEAGSSIPSVRYYIFNYIKENEPELFNKIILAEKINDWLDGSPYDHLLELERDLAGLVSVIPLFLESYGAVAELGSFVSENQIRSRLLVFMEEKYYEAPSFIYLGPIKLLLKEEKGQVLAYSWENTDGKLDEGMLLQLAPEICNEIKEFLKRKDETKKFSASMAAHKILLMSDFIDIAYVARYQEIARFFDKCGIPTLEKDIKKYLLIAEKLGLIAMQNEGREKFYFSPNFERVNFITKIFPANDRLAWMTKFRAYVKTNEKVKERALSNWFTRNGEKK